MNKKYALVTVCIFMLVFQACSNPSPTPISEPTKIATLATSTSIPTSTLAPTSTPTPIPLALSLATTGNGMLVSTDKCGSWQASNNGLGNLFVNTIAIDPNNPDFLYAGTDGGIYVSFDSGATWGQVNDGVINSNIVYSIAVNRDSNVYVATPYGIFKLGQK